jgi:hypothetical protein
VKIKAPPIKRIIPTIPAIVRILLVLHFFFAITDPQIIVFKVSIVKKAAPTLPTAMKIKAAHEKI